MDSPELWKDVPGYEGFYQVSDHGRVKALSRVIQRRAGRRATWTEQRWPEHIMHTSLHSRYAKVGLHNRERQAKHYNVNVLVLLTFIGPCPPGHQACHNDGNKHNNRLSNLRWDTPKNNHADKRQHGTHLLGETKPQAKLTEQQVRAIRDDIRPHETIARDFGIALSNVWLIKARRSWKHVE